MTEWITGLMERWGYGGILLLMFLENLFPPLPSEVIMPLAGFTAAQGDLHFAGVLVSGVTGSVLGTLLWYELGRRFSGERLKSWADRYGYWLTLSRQDLERAVRWFRRHGRSAVLVGRLVPGVRTVISVPAGLCGMPPLSFLVYTTVGSFGWTLFLTVAGYVLQQQWPLVQQYLTPIGKLTLGLLLLWVLARFIKQYRRSRNPIEREDNARSP
jgi:membrane protein DedA with SNARE-associated domain